MERNLAYEIGFLDFSLTGKKKLYYKDQLNKATW